MLNKKYQTDKYLQRISFGKTVKFPVSTQHTIKSISSNSRHQSRVSSKKNIPHCPLSQTHKKTPLPKTSLKSRFDQLVNDLFLKIDFDCSGYITYTKINFCKEIPERVFYFFGGVFQKVRQLGGVATKLFTKMCEEAYVQANIQDLQAILSSNHQTVKEDKDDKNGVQIKINMRKGRLQDRKQEHLQFSTKKIDSVGPKYSLKIKTQRSQNNNHKDFLLDSARRMRLSSIYPLKQKENSFHETSNTEQQPVSFQSNKVRILTQRLNRQIQQCNNRLNANQQIN